MRPRHWPAVFGAISILGLSLLTACGEDDSKDNKTDPPQGVQGRAGLCASIQLLGKALPSSGTSPRPQPLPRRTA